MTGNLQLDVLFGAGLHFAGGHEWTELDLATRELVAELRAAGRRPYHVPVR
jgi:hypothetical protein